MNDHLDLSHDPHPAPVLILALGVVVAGTSVLAGLVWLALRMRGMA